MAVWTTVRTSALSMPMPKAMVATTTSSLPDEEVALDALACGGVEAGVVGGGGVRRGVRRRALRRICGRARRRWRGGWILSSRRFGGELVAAGLGDLDDFDGEVVAAEAVDEEGGVV